MSRFASLTRRQQIDRLRRAATTALAQFGLDDARLRLVVHDFNTTFRVDGSTGDRFALRINLNASRPTEEVRAEASWVEAIALETDVLVPYPQRTVEGDLVATVPCADLDRPVTVVVYEWLEGRNLGTSARPGHVRELGRSAALLHDHASTWRLPAGTNRPVFDSLLMDADDHLTGLEAPWYSNELRVLVADARAHLDDVLGTALTPTSGEWHLIHGDLHLWNARLTNRGVAVFDFDDCGVGTPVHDLAISAFYMRQHDGLEAAMLDGYRTARELDLGDGSVFEAHIASRSLLLLNDVAGSINASHVEMLHGYADKTARRLRHYLDHGNFVPDPPAR